ncbi:hypothetical protein D3C73_1351540 [compost metagenome]
MRLACKRVIGTCVNELLTFCSTDSVLAWASPDRALKAAGGAPLGRFRMCW